MVIDPQTHRRPTRRSFPAVVQTTLTAEIGWFSRLKMTQDSPSSAAGQEPTQLTNPVPCPQPASQPSPASMDHHKSAELSQGRVSETPKTHQRPPRWHKPSLSKEPRKATLS